MARLRALVTLCLGGCSFALVQSPPEHRERLAYFECTTSWLGPGLDAAFTAVTGLIAFGLIGQTDEEWEMAADDEQTPEVEEPPYSRKFGIGLFGTLAALGASGMVWGITQATICKEAKTDMAARLKPNTWPEVAPPAAAPPTSGASSRRLPTSTR